MPFTVVGLMRGGGIIVGFFGFLMACVIIPGEAWSWYGHQSTTIYGTPMTLSALAFNILMGMSGGIIGAYVIARDPFFMMSGALAGIISTASGLDVYDPSLAMIVGFGGGALLKPAYDWLERRGIDDAVGAVTVHGTIGLYGLIIFGITGAGLPAIQGDGVATVSLIGQIVGAIVFFLLGFVPGYVVSWILNKVGMLRVSEEAEIAGLDTTKVPMQAYPEGIAPSAPAAD